MLAHLVFWHWLILAALLLVVELFSWTFFFLWLSVAAAITGGVKFLFPHLIWEMQFLVFAVLALIAVFAWTKMVKSKKLSPVQKALNNRAQQYVGQTYKLATPLHNGRGKISLGDSLWLVKGEEDLPVGTSVVVLSVDSTVLVVEKA